MEMGKRELIITIFPFLLVYHRTFCQDKKRWYELTESFRNFRVVHFGIVLGDFAALETRPDHKGVHGSLDVILTVLAVAATRFITAAYAHRHASHHRLLVMDHRRARAHRQRSNRMIAQRLALLMVRDRRAGRR